MIYNLEDIGNRIKTERKSHHMSQDELCEYIATETYHSCTRPTLSKWEKGESMPSVDILLKLCELFDCELGYLLCEHDTKKRVNQSIQDVTGLSENAIECLSQWNSEAQNKADSFHAAGYGREFLNSQIGYTSNEYLDIINLLFEIRHETDRNGNCSDSPNSHIFYLIHSYLNHNIKRISNVTKDDYESLEISEDGIQVSENSDGVSDEFNLSEIHKRITLDKIRDELEEIAKWKSANDK